MRLIYQIINFALLVLILWFFGRKMIAGLFTKRKVKITNDLEAMQAGHETAQESGLRLKEAQAAHETALAQSAMEIQTRNAVNLAETQAMLQSESAQREQALQVSIGNARRSMIKRLKRKMLIDVAESAPDILRIPDDYGLRSLQRIQALIAPTRADLVYLKAAHSLPLKLSSVTALDEASVRGLSQSLRSKFPTVDWPEGAFVPCTLDPALLGGVKLQIHDTVYDGSVQNLLEMVATGITITTPDPEDGLKQVEAKLESAFRNLDTDVKIYQIGRVESVSDGICLVSGLSDALFGELLRFESGVEGMVMNLDQNSIGCVLFGEFEKVEEGSQARRTGHVIEVPVGNELLGRVVDGLGKPIDNLGDMLITRTRPVEMPAPGIIDRKSVDVPMYTGVKAVDALIPIGRGQRELIIGDRKTGKSAIAIDAIINQKGKGVLCIYVAIGQKETTVASITQVLRKHGAMEYTIIVCADAYHSAPMQYIAPYTGTSMGEYFMSQGKDVLIVYDDLSKHAVAYREISLLLHRPSGREAYPGDVFYLHSRLLERSARLTPQAGGGSMTALPIIETQEGDISAYIPTNAISITDGQIFLESDLFNEGQVPAINIGLSVSRVGGTAQIGPMRQVASRLRMELAQYRELSSFSQFGSDLDQGTKDSLARGDRMMYALRQAQYQPVPVALQVLMLQTVARGFADDVDPKDIPRFLTALCQSFQLSYPELLERLAQPKKLDDAELNVLAKAIAHCKETWQ